MLVLMSIGLPYENSLSEGLNDFETNRRRDRIISILKNGIKNLHPSFKFKQTVLYGSNNVFYPVSGNTPYASLPYYRTGINLYF